MRIGIGIGIHSGGRVAPTVLLPYEPPAIGEPTFAPDHSIAPFGTALINETVPSGGGLSVDSSQQFLGEDSTKINIPVNLGGAVVEVGTSTASFDLDAEAEQALARTKVIAVKTDGANTITGALLSVGNGSLSVGYQFNRRNYYTDTHDGWTIFVREPGADAVGGSPDLSGNVRTRLTLTASANIVAGDIWVGFAGVLESQPPTVVLTFDDGYAEWTWLASELASRGLPASFGISYGDIGKAGYLTSSAVQAIGNHASGLFEITNHAEGNDSLGDLGLSGYIDAVEDCRTYIEGLGLDPYAAKLHAWVQGNLSIDAINELRSRGYPSARAVETPGMVANHVGIALDGADSNALYGIPATAYLNSSHTVAQVQAQLDLAKHGGTIFVVGHEFKGSAGANGWINGYDDDYGILDLLDWLKAKQDNDDWKILKWSDWRKQIARRYPTLDDAPTDTSPPPLSQTKPTKGVPVPFGDYETVIVRLTDDGKLHGYSTQPAFNADQTKVFLTGYPYRIVDLLGNQVGDLITGGDIDYMQLAFWDPVNPNLLWGSHDSGSSVCCFDISASEDAFTSWLLPGGYDETIIGGGEGCISNDGRYIPLISTKGGNAYVTVWDALEEEVEGTLTLTGWDFRDDIDNVLISQSGQYLIVASQRSGARGHRIYDRATLAYLRSYYGGGSLDASNGIAGHADVGYRSGGGECLFTQNDNGDIVTVLLSDASERVEIESWMLAYNMHFSCRNIKRPGYGYVSMHSDSDQSHEELYRQVFAIKLDGNGQIEIFGEAMFNESADSYDWQAHACASPYGDIVVMGSVWQGSSPDTYIMYVPETMPEPPDPEPAAISFVGGAADAADSVALPTHEAGDLIVVFAFLDSDSGTAPALPGGFTSLANGDNAPVPFRVGYKIAASGSEASGEWTGADYTAAYIWRGVGSIGAVASGRQDSSVTVLYPALTLQDAPSIVAAIGTNYRDDRAQETPPTGMTLRASHNPGSIEFAAFDTDEPVASWSQQTVNIGGATTTGWTAVCVELVAA